MKINNMVSCIIPTYKRKETLLRAIKSVINQTYKNLEIIIIDDNDLDSDLSKEINKMLINVNDERIIYIKPDKHVNGAFARNCGIKKAKGKYIAFLDDDDIWEVDKLEKQIIFLEKNTTYDGVSCFFGYYSDNKLVRNSIPYNTENIHYKILSRKISVCTPTLLFKKESLFKTGLFDEELIRHQDLQLLLDFTAKKKLGVIQERLVKVTIDDGINRPDTKKIIQIKKTFLLKMNNHLKMYSSLNRKRIKNAHFFEIIYIAIKNRNWLTVLKYLFIIGISPRAYVDLFKKMKARKTNTI